MDFFSSISSLGPILLVGLAMFVILLGLLRRIAKLAFVGVAVAVIGLVLWPVVSGMF